MGEEEGGITLLLIPTITVSMASFFCNTFDSYPLSPHPHPPADRGLCQDQWTILQHYKTFSIFQLFLTAAKRVGFVEHLSRTKVAQQTVTRSITMTVTNSATTKAAVKHDLLFNKPASAFTQMLD